MIKGNNFFILFSKFLNLENENFKQIALKLACLFIFIFGLFASLKTTLAVYRVEPDSVYPLTIWHEILQHGFLQWLKNWCFTCDNWLFTGIPLNFIGLAIFGVNPTTPFITGWAIFAISTVVSGLLARELGAKKSLYLLPILLIFAGHFAYKSGCITIPSDHVITNLFGLISLLLLIKWIYSQKLLFLFIVFILLLAAGLSDPWLIPTYILPLSFLALFSAFRTKDPIEKKQFFYLFWTTVFLLILLRTRLFWVLKFLPQFNLNLTAGDWSNIKNNTIPLAKDLGGLFNLVPGNKSNLLIPSMTSLLLVFFLLAICLYLLRAYKPLLSRFNILLFTLISTAGIILSNIISILPIPPASATRYLVNILFLVPITIAVYLEKNWKFVNKNIKRLTVAAVSLFIISGFTSNYDLIKKTGFSINSTEVDHLIAFLNRNHLTYGYGPYWGSLSTAVSAASNQKIIIRPVVFRHHLMMPRGVWSSRQWGREDDAPLGQKNFFVLVVNDEEVCPDPHICIKDLISHFGSPVKRLKYHNGIVLVWNHPLINGNSHQ